MGSAVRALSLFSGIGGIDLACEWAGIETVAFCEREPFPQRILKQHWPGVPIYDDVRTLTKERLEADGIGAIDIIHGGYPCQPFSVAGLRKGEDDDRHLWPEVFRLIKEIRPRWFVGENVTGHITMGLDEVCTDLEKENYQTRVFVLSALSVGAPHKRERVFVAGNTSGKPKPQADTTTGSIGSERDSRENTTWVTRGSISPSYWATHQPPIPGVDDGLPDRVERSIALGNAVVPQQIYPIFAAIMQIDEAVYGR